MTTASSRATREVPVYDRPDDDWYVDPAWCTELLLREESFYGLVCDPCAGQGTIPGVCNSFGLTTIASDINPKAAHIQLIDFLGDDNTLAPNIIFNPPYIEAEAFIRHALRRATRKVAALVQEKFCYSQTRHPLFTETPLARLYFFSSRPSMPPGRELRAGTVKAKGGKVNYLWMVWDHLHKGPPQAFWLKREAA